VAAGAKARRAAQSRWVEVAGRAGLVAKGGIYLVIGLLAIQIPLGLGGQAADRQGALRSLAREPYGKATILALAVGFAGYALWRLVQAALDRDHEGTGAKGIAKRLVHFAKAVLYGASSVAAFALLAGASDGGSNERQDTAQVLALPLGRWLVAAAGAGFFAAGLYNAYRSVTGKFRDHLRENELGKTARGWAIAVGVVGHAARGVVFALIGAFLLKAAAQFDAKEAVGLDGALLKVAEQPYGPLLLGLVAAGLVAYALYCGVQARYRDV